MYLPATVAIGIIHCGVNDINGTAGKAYRPQEIAENVISCGFKLRQRHPLMSIIIAGILPAMETNWGRKSRIVKVNEVLKGLCSQSGFRFIEPDESWVEEDGCINQNLFWRDGLHLNKKGCTKLKDLYVEAINASMCGITQSVPKDKQLPLPTFIPPQIDDNSYQHDPPRKPLIKIPSSHQCHNRPKSKKKKEKVLPIMSTQSKQPEPDDSTKKSVNNDPDDEKMDIKINKSKCYMFGLKFRVFFLLQVLFCLYFTFSVNSGVIMDVDVSIVQPNLFVDFFCFVKMFVVNFVDLLICLVTSGVLWDFFCLFSFTGFIFFMKKILFNLSRQRRPLTTYVLTNILILSLGTFWILNAYQKLHLQCCDTLPLNQPPELRAMNYIFYAKDNQCFTLKSYIFLEACRKIN